MKISCIYKIRSAVKPDKFYIGSAIDFAKRKKFHISTLRLNKHSNSHLQLHVNKYGIDDISFEIIERVHNSSELLKREQYYIDLFCPTFNILKTAGSASGYRHTKTAIHKIRISKIGKKTGPLPDIVKERLSESHKRGMTQERRERISNTLTGHSCSAQTREKISKANTGKRMSAEHKDKLLSINLGSHRSSETKLAIAKKLTGIKRSEDSIAKMRAAQKGRTFSHESRLKISASKMGKVHSEETKEKMRQSQQRRRNERLINNR